MGCGRVVRGVNGWKGGGRETCEVRNGMDLRDEVVMREEESGWKRSERVKIKGGVGGAREGG